MKLKNSWKKPRNSWTIAEKYLRNNWKIAEIHLINSWKNGWEIAENKLKSAKWWFILANSSFSSDTNILILICQMNASVKVESLDNARSLLVSKKVLSATFRSQIVVVTAELSDLKTVFLEMCHSYKYF